MSKNISPDYIKIYSDIIDKKYPYKKTDCKQILTKKKLSVLDILTLNKIIFGVPDKQTEIINQKYRSYNKKDILQILDYQKKHNLNNRQLASHFSISRNTITKWKRLFFTS